VATDILANDRRNTDVQRYRGRNRRGDRRLPVRRRVRSLHLRAARWRSDSPLHALTQPSPSRAVKQVHLEKTAVYGNGY